MVHTRRRKGRRYAAFWIMATVTAACGWLFASAVRTTMRLDGASLQAQFRRNLEQFYCMTASAHRAVPRGAAISIAYPDDSYNFQQVSEFLADWATVVPGDQAPARAALGPGPCQGQGVVVSTP